MKTSNFKKSDNNPKLSDNKNVLRDNEVKRNLKTSSKAVKEEIGEKKVKYRQNY